MSPEAITEAANRLEAELPWADQRTREAIAAENPPVAEAPEVRAA